MEEKTQKCPCSKKSQILKIIILIILVVFVVYVAFLAKDKNVNQDNLKNIGVNNENPVHSATGEITIQVAPEVKQ